MQMLISSSTPFRGRGQSGSAVTSVLETAEVSSFLPLANSTDTAEQIFGTFAVTVLSLEIQWPTFGMMTSQSGPAAFVLFLFVMRVCAGTGKLYVKSLTSQGTQITHVTTDARDRVTVPSSAELTLTCTGDDVSPVTYFLYKGTPNRGNMLVPTNRNPLTYIIPNVSFPNDSNVVYGCESWQGGGFSMTLVVLAPPVVTHAPDAKFPLGLGSNITLECSAYGNPDPSISFLLGEQIVTPASFAMVENTTVDTRTVHLVKGRMEATISSIEFYGNYTCLVNNTQGKWTGSTIVRPLVKPRIDSEGLTGPITVVKVGTKLSLTCSASGDPLPRIVWILPRGASNASYNVTNQNQMIISRLEMNSASYEDNGNYSCVAMTGQFFQDRAGTAVKVVGQPDSPTNVTVSNVTSTTALIAFVLGFDGRLPILHSTIQWTQVASSQSRPIEIDGSTNFAVLDHLRPFSVYNVVIFSTNSIGKSSNSATVVFTTDTAAPVGVPSAVKAFSVNSTSIHIQWNEIPEASWNSPTRGYIIQYASSNYTVQPDERRRVNYSVLIIDLNPYTTYQVSVAAFNSKGHGNFSHHVYVTTNEDRPALPPNVTIIACWSQSLFVQHETPDREHINGILLGFYIIVRDNDLGSVVVNVTVNSTHRSTNITQLRPFTWYSIQVAAFTRPGIGPWSRRLVFQTDEELSGPPTLFLRHAGISSVTLGWHAPQNLGGNVSQYKITYKKDGEPVAESDFIHAVPTAHVQNTTIVGLAPETNYTFVVYAINGKGLGKPSEYLQVATLSGQMGLTSQTVTFPSSTSQTTGLPFDSSGTEEVFFTGAVSTDAVSTVSTSVTSKGSDEVSILIPVVIPVIAVVAIMGLIVLFVLYRRRIQSKKRGRFRPGMSFANQLSGDVAMERHSKHVTAMMDTPIELRENSYVVGFEETHRDSEMHSGSPGDDSVFEENGKCHAKSPPSLTNRPSEAEIVSALVKQRASASSEFQQRPHCSDDESEYEHPYSCPANSQIQQGKKSSIKVRHDEGVDNDKMAAGSTENKLILNLPASLKGKPVDRENDYGNPQDTCGSEVNDVFPQDSVKQVQGDCGTVETYEPVEITPRAQPAGGKKLSFFGRLRGGKKTKQRSKSSSALKGDSKGTKATQPRIARSDIRGRSKSVPERPPMEAVDETVEYQQELTIRPSSCRQSEYTQEDTSDHVYELVGRESRTYAQLQFSKSQEMREKAEHQYVHVEPKQEQPVQVVEPNESNSVSDHAKQDGETEFSHDDEQAVDGSLHHDSYVVQNPMYSETQPVHSSQPALYASVDLDVRNQHRQERAARQASAKASEETAQETSKYTEVDIDKSTSSTSRDQSSVTVLNGVHPSLELRSDQ